MTIFSNKPKLYMMTISDFSIEKRARCVMVMA